jgi:16S rRNA (guanine527-N7)-methyltransferase
VTPETIATLLQPYINAKPDPAADQPDCSQIYAQLVQYLELILKWNARINLTAIRTPEEIVRRHFGESLFAGAHLGPCSTLLDLGSGAGFPGVPIQLLRLDLKVTLAESQNKKAAFLHEVIRTLGLSTEVWSGRAEAMPAARRFDVVTLRAVDHMESAIREAGIRATSRVVILGTSRASLAHILSADFEVTERLPLPESNDGILEILHRR